MVGLDGEDLCICQFRLLESAGVMLAEAALKDVVERSGFRHLDIHAADPSGKLTDLYRC